MARALRAARILLLPTFVGSFAIFGFIPEYRVDKLDWQGAVALTTHLVLWSVVPTDDGSLLDNAKLISLLKKDSPLVKAIQGAAGKSPRILISVGGGAGRSEQFAEAASKKQSRKKLAKQLSALLETYPLLSGIELHWELPTSPAHWRDLGRLAREVRAAMPAAAGLGTGQGKPLLTLSFHPNVGAVGNFSSLRGKEANEGSFVEMFDYCQGAAYSSFNSERQHSTYAMDLKAVEEWEQHGLPADRLTLGLPTFGVHRRTVESHGYSDILAKEPALKMKPDADNSEDGIYFVGVDSIAAKVRFAKRRGLGGVALWELGQDVWATGPDKQASLLRSVYAASLAQVSFTELLQTLAERSKVTEELAFMVLTSLVGGYYMIRVLFFRPPMDYGDCDWPPKRRHEHPQPQDQDTNSATNGDRPAAAAATQEETSDG